jgi:predicted RNase H-like nuclease
MTTSPDRPWILGLDLAWRAHNPSGAVALRWRADGVLHAVHAATLGSDEAILQWIDRIVPEGPALIAIDAPLIAPNGPGTARPVDRLVSSRFGRFDAGAYPANREVAARPVGLARRLSDVGWSLDPAHAVGTGRCAIEVYPHAATVGLFGLDRIVKYKKGSATERRQGLERLQGLLLRYLPMLDPPIEPPAWVDVSTLRGRMRKALEDRLDAWVCAAMAAVFLARRDECEVLGDVTHGYIVVPRLPVPV